MHLNGQSVSGRFEEDGFRCFVSPIVASRSEGLPFLDRAVVQANYQGTCFTADVPIVVRDIDCDVIIGREWISLLCLVVSQLNGAGAKPHGSPFPSHLEESSFSQHSGAEALPRGSPSPSHLEESSYDLFSPDGSVGSSSSAASGREGIHLVEPGVGEGRLQTICMLENALLADGTQPCECHFFQLCLKISCQSHEVVVHEGSDFGDETLVYGHMWSAKG